MRNQKNTIVALASIAVLIAGLVNVAVAAEANNPKPAPVVRGQQAEVHLVANKRGGSSGSSQMQNGGYGRGGIGGLPYGRRYYNGRYFGNLNNRYYGPQYGYF